MLFCWTRLGPTEQYRIQGQYIEMIEILENTLDSDTEKIHSIMIIL